MRSSSRLLPTLTGSPQDIINPTTGYIAGLARHSLYGTRAWTGTHTSPLLFAGQYKDAESGWAYNRFRYYSPTLGAYNAQDPLGLAPRVASAQGYVDHAAHRVDVLGLHGREAHLEPKTIKSKDTGNFRGDSYTKLDTVGSEGTPIERHHLIGQHALKENGVSSRHTPSIMMDKADHALTRNHQKMAGHDAFRQVEKARVKEAAEPAKNGDRSLYEDMLLDEAADIEKRIPGKYDVPLNEALDFYIANPEIAFPS